MLDLYSKLYLDTVPYPSYHHFTGFIDYYLKNSIVTFDDGLLWLDKETLLFYPAKGHVPDEVKEIKIAYKPPSAWSYEVFDRVYYIEPSYSMKLENFKKNAKRFEVIQEPFYTPITEKEAYDFFTDWLSKKAKEKLEFHMIEEHYYLLKNTKTYNLRLTGIYTNKLHGISLWGELKEGIAIHLLCCDSGMGFAQDYLRYKTYQDMISSGYRLVCDGSDLGDEGLRKYKTKLRPYLIIPFFTLRRWLDEGTIHKR